MVAKAHIRASPNVGFNNHGINMLTERPSGIDKNYDISHVRVLLCVLTNYYITNDYDIRVVRVLLCVLITMTSLLYEYCKCNKYSRFTHRLAQRISQSVCSYGFKSVSCHSVFYPIGNAIKRLMITVYWP